MNYYGSYNGWNIGGSEETRRLYRLKNLKPIDALFGEVFHQTVQYSIRNFYKDIINPDIFKQRLYRALALKYRESKYCFEQWKSYPKMYAMISEIYYNSDLTREQADRLSEKIETCCKNIFRSDSFQEIIRDNDAKIKEIEDLQHFTFQDLKVYVKLDTLFQSRIKNKWIILDWKTFSKPKVEDEEQLLFYMFYLTQVHNIKPEDIETRVEYVLLNDSKTYIFNEEDFEFVKGKLGHDIEVLKSYLIDVDNNIPMSQENFKQQKSASNCSRCNYREVCYESEQGTDSYSYKVVGIGK